MHPRPRLLATSPLFVVADLDRALRFYRDRLGFTATGVWGDPPCFAMLHRDGCELMLSTGSAGAAPTPNGPTGTWDLYLRVTDLAAETAACRAAGVPFAQGPKDQPYGMREVEVLDPDGHRLCFAQDTSAAPARATESWTGVLDLGAARLRLALALVRKEDGEWRGWLDSPDQGASHLPVEQITRTATQLGFAMPAIGAAFSGQVDAAAATVTGAWNQRGRSWPLVFHKA